MKFQTAIYQDFSKAEKLLAFNYAADAVLHVRLHDSHLLGRRHG